MPFHFYYFYKNSAANAQNKAHELQAQLANGSEELERLRNIAKEKEEMLNHLKEQLAKSQEEKDKAVDELNKKQEDQH